MGSEPDFLFFLVSGSDPDFSEATMARTIIVDGGEKIACPKCNHGFPLSEGISRQTIERYAGDFERSVAAHRKKLEAELAAEAKAQFEQQRKALHEALSAKEGALARFRSEELQLRRSLRELEEADKNRDVEYQRRLDEERRRIEAQFKAQIESAQREAADLKRKLEQGSQQLQGEALELSLEALLRNAFPLDEIVPVPKGMNGADLLQHVHSSSGHCCGTIIWEAKQTKAWQPAWLRKLKDDQQAIGAELAVIVTAAMPRDGSGRSSEPFMREAELTRMSDGLLGVVGDLQGIGQESLAQLDSIAALPVPEDEPMQN